ncbi:hypothetical protein L596_025541 [Steinernema carpocapsae]|uniref:Uncharacterized protein n=1 Tax=Steinernema carpocapsae TaxID=34508 RepID=A0A4U5M8W1_STECR|nr:hypothetical protein L596_025541 [Steinernema carpocapsae]
MRFFLVEWLENTIVTFFFLFALFGLRRILTCQNATYRRISGWYFFRFLGYITDRHLFFLGPRGSGKSRLLQRLREGYADHNSPEFISCHYKFFNDYHHEVSCQEFLAKRLWKRWFPGSLIFCDKIVICYVVDVSEPNSVAQAKEEIQNLLTHEEVKKLPVAIFGNKADLPGALSRDEFVEAIDSEDTLFRDRDTNAYAFTCSLEEGNGFHEPFQWIAKFRLPQSVVWLFSEDLIRTFINI